MTERLHALEAVDQVRLENLRLSLRVAAADLIDLDARIKYDASLTTAVAFREAERFVEALVEDIRKGKAT
jgi:hypothetical protein